METGFGGLAVYIFLLGSSIMTLVKIRRQRYADGDQQRFFVTSANALLCSTSGFMTGGAFLSLALNDLSWLMLALVATLDRLSARATSGTAAAAAVPAFAAPAGLSFGTF